MKKNLLVLTMSFLLGFSSQAQQTLNARKPTAGDISTEINMGLFGNYGYGYYNYGYYNNSSNSFFQNYFNNIKFRYFKNDKTAYRLTLNPAFSNEKFNRNQDEFGIANILNLSINPGIEKHFAGTERLSPYIGSELTFNIFRVNSKITNAINNTVTKIKNGFYNSDNYYTNARSFTRTGINLIAGADYYVTKNIFLGIELGYGFGYMKEKDLEITPQSQFPINSKGSKYFAMNAYTNQGLRFGFAF